MARKFRSLTGVGLLLCAASPDTALLYSHSSLEEQQVIPSAASSSSDLGVRIEVHGQGILVSWNREAAVVRSAKKGVLQIDDGSQQRTTELEPAELANGSILYRPESSDVDFRLTIYSGDGSMVTDGARLPAKSKRTGVTTPFRVEPYLDVRPEKGPVESDLRPSPLPRNSAKEASATRTHPRRTVEKSSPARVAVQPDKAQRNVSGHQPRLEAPIHVEAAGESNARQTSLAANRPTKPRIEQTETADVKAAKLPAADSRSLARTAVARGKVLQNYVPPRPVKTVMLNAGLFEPRLIEAITRIEVELDVNEYGRVTAARALDSGSVNELVTNAAVAAAKEWVFEPAKIDGKNVPAKHTVVFHLGAR